MFWFNPSYPFFFSFFLNLSVTHFSLSFVVLFSPKVHNLINCCIRGCKRRHSVTSITNVPEPSQIKRKIMITCLFEVADKNSLQIFIGLLGQYWHQGILRDNKKKDNLLFSWKSQNVQENDTYWTMGVTSCLWPLVTAHLRHNQFSDVIQSMKTICCLSF